MSAYDKWGNLVFRGTAKGGPKDGEVIESIYLTTFFSRKLEYINHREVEDNYENYMETIKRNSEAAKRPHRYDFNQNEGYWEYIEYIPASLDDEQSWSTDEEER